MIRLMNDITAALTRKGRASLRVLIISPHLLLGEAMETWLRQQQGIDVVGWEATVDHADASIQALEPDVVICDTTEAARTPLTALMCKLADRPGAAVFNVNMADNSISVFSSRDQAMECMAWLLDVIRGIPSSTADEGSEKS